MMGTDSRSCSGRTWPRVLVGIVVVLGLFAWQVLPQILHAAGLHPVCEEYAGDLTGRRALVVATNHDTLGDTGRPTGVAASELTAAYYEFLDAGMEVDVASPLGGRIPVDPQTLLWLIRSEYDERYLDDPVLTGMVEESLSVADLDVSHYDIVYLAGGWGAAWDLGKSGELGDAVTEAWQAGAVVGGVCHGPLGLLLARDEQGQALVRGRRLTAVTDKQLRELGIEMTPQHPESELRGAGALFEANTALRDILATRVVVDGRLVTGQNQNSGCATAQAMMKVTVESGRRKAGA